MSPATRTTGLRWGSFDPGRPHRRFMRTETDGRLDGPGSEWRDRPAQPRAACRQPDVGREYQREFNLQISPHILAGAARLWSRHSQAPPRGRRQGAHQRDQPHGGSHRMRCAPRGINEFGQAGRQEHERRPQDAADRRPVGRAQDGRRHRRIERGVHRHARRRPVERFGQSQPGRRLSQARSSTTGPTRTRRSGRPPARPSSRSPPTSRTATRTTRSWSPGSAPRSTTAPASPRSPTTTAPSPSPRPTRTAAPS